MTLGNWRPLTPLSFLERSAEVWRDKTAVIHGDLRWTYGDFNEQAVRTARAFQQSGVRPGDRVAYLCPNIPEMLVAHFAVPLAGAVLVAINTRLSSEEVAYICNHSGARTLVVDTDLQGTVEPIVEGLTTVEEIISVDDAGVEATLPGVSYDEFLGRGSFDPLPYTVDDENGLLSINYTSGTTGRPKGAMYGHRAAYLNAVGEIIHTRFQPESTFLWTLPMFHCNGWCNTWAVTAIGGTHVCLRAVRAPAVWDLIRRHRVTHLNAAPTVLITLANDPSAGPLDHELIVTTGGSPPSPTLISQFENLGIRLHHIYGMTELTGVYTICEEQPGWADLSADERAQMMARQGVPKITTGEQRVVDENMNDVPRDGATMGELVLRGNSVTKGYFEDPDATEESFRGGWFHSGDGAVWHPDGYIELRDRIKDMLISGGENISTIEVEQALASHPAVLECAVIGVPHEHWGERPKAYVIAKEDATVSEDELREHVRSKIAHYKAPDSFAFVSELPKTSTGKIQKFALREKEWAGRERRIQ
jgi:fatty-acyl-CoA synthase